MITETFIIAKIGINHNGDLNLAKKLIDIAVVAGCDAVEKFLKRTVDKVCLDSSRQSPWGDTQRAQKEGEFGQIYRARENRSYCREHGMRLSGPKLGRPSVTEKADKKQISIESKWNADSD